MKQLTFILSIILVVFIISCSKKDNNPVTPPANNIPTQGLVASYLFNGNANDESGNGNNGNVIGATLTKDRHGKENSAYSFNGISNLIKTNFTGVLGKSSRTISIWAKTINPQMARLLTYGKSAAGANFCCGFNYVSTPAGVHCDIGWAYRQDSTNATDGNWHHYVWVVPDIPAPTLGDVKIYKDGNLLTIPNAGYGNTQSIDTGSDTNWTVEIGHQDTHYFDGLIDDIRIYNRALSDSEIKALYNE